jgi:hypothetical protein
MYRNKKRKISGQSYMRVCETSSKLSGGSSRPGGSLKRNSGRRLCLAWDQLPKITKDVIIRPSGGARIFGGQALLDLLPLHSSRPRICRKRWHRKQAGTHLHFIHEVLPPLAIRRVRQKRGGMARPRCVGSTLAFEGRVFISIRKLLELDFLIGSVTVTPSSGEMYK